MRTLHAAQRPSVADTIAAARFAAEHHCSWLESTQDARDLAALGKALIKLEPRSKAVLEMISTAENTDRAMIAAARLLLEAQASAAPRPTRAADCHADRPVWPYSTLGLCHECHDLASRIATLWYGARAAGLPITAEAAERCQANVGALPLTTLGQAVQA